MIDLGFGVRLGPLDSKYIEQIRDWRNDPKIWTNCRQNDVISDLEQGRWFERQDQDPSIRMYAVLDLEDQILGVTGLTSIDWINRRAEFSLYIAPGIQSRGHGRQALATLFHHGFRNLGLHLIWGESYEYNSARSLFRNLGMTEEGKRRQFYFRDGKFIDAYLYSITAEEWECSWKRFSQQ